MSGKTTITAEGKNGRKKSATRAVISELLDAPCMFADPADFVSEPGRSLFIRAQKTIADALEAKDELGQPSAVAARVAVDIFRLRVQYALGMPKQKLEHDGVMADGILIHGGAIKVYHADAPINDV